MLVVGCLLLEILSCLSLSASPQFGFIKYLTSIPSKIAATITVTIIPSLLLNLATAVIVSPVALYSALSVVMSPLTSPRMFSPKAMPTPATTITSASGRMSPT